MSAVSSSSDHSPIFVFAGGGSGGHLYPGLAIADELKRLHPEIRSHFVCSDRDIDRQILAHAGASWTPLQMPTAGRLWRQPWRQCPNFWRAWREAVNLLRGHSQAIVVGTGGFVSVPVVLAACWMRRPVVLLEPNAVPGRATTVLQRFTQLVCTGFPETAEGLRRSTPLLNTGIALRTELTSGATGNDLAGRPRQILVLGGSQGAAELNELVLRAVQEDSSLFAGWTIRHQVGSGGVERAREIYEAAGVTADVQTFFDPIADAYRSSQLVISRAGATSLAEFACAGLPAVLVPHRQAVRNHQHANAVLFSKAGAAVVVAGSTEGERLAELRTGLKGLLGDENLRTSCSLAMRQQARPHAAADIAAALMHLVESVAC